MAEWEEIVSHLLSVTYKIQHRNLIKLRVHLLFPENTLFKQHR